MTTKLPARQGGTGTEVEPTAGQILVGQSDGTYLPETPSTGAVSYVSDSDGSLNFSPTTGIVLGSVNMNHANTWTSVQTFNAGIVGSTANFDADIYNAVALVVKGDDASMNHIADFYDGNNNLKVYINSSGSLGVPNIIIGTSSTTGYVWTATDNSGDGSWQAAPNPFNQTLNTGDSVSFAGFQLSTTPTSGYVLTSDSGGTGTWQAPGNPFNQSLNTSDGVSFSSVNATNFVATSDVSANSFTVQTGISNSNGSIGLSTGSGGDIILGGSSSETVQFLAGDTGGSPGNPVTPVKWLAEKDTSGAVFYKAWYQ